MSSDETPEAPDAGGPYLPLYLDQPLIASLLQVLDPSGRPATYEIDEGTTAEEAAGNDEGMEARIGISGPFAAKGGGHFRRTGSEKGIESFSTRTQYVVETASLFEAAHAELRRAGHIKTAGGQPLSALRTGMWIELELVLVSPSPERAIDLMVRALGALEIARSARIDRLTKLEELLRKKPSAEANKHFTEQALSYGKMQGIALDRLIGELLGGGDDDEAMLGPIARTLSSELGGKAVDDLVARLASDPEDPSRVVLTVDRERFTAAHEGILEGTRFHVLGKVTNVLEGADTISLTRRTMLGMFGDETLRDMLDALPDKLGKADIQTVVKSPAVQVLPLAIWV